jgi:hypothetical protein
MKSGPTARAVIRRMKAFSRIVCQPPIFCQRRGRALLQAPRLELPSARTVRRRTRKAWPLACRTQSEFECRPSAKHAGTNKQTSTTAAVFRELPSSAPMGAKQGQRSPEGDKATAGTGQDGLARCDVITRRGQGEQSLVWWVGRTEAPSGALSGAAAVEADAAARRGGHRLMMSLWQPRPDCGNPGHGRPKALEGSKEKARATRRQSGKATKRQSAEGRGSKEARRGNKGVGSNIPNLRALTGQHPAPRGAPVRRMLNRHRYLQSLFTLFIYEVGTGWSAGAAMGQQGSGELVSKRKKKSLCALA